MSPRAKKRQKLTATAPQQSTSDTSNLNAQDFMAKSRENTINALRGATGCICDYDNLDQLIVMVRALIETNREIWERCKQNLVEKNEKAMVESPPSNLKFYRVGYTSVDVTTRSNNGYGNVKDSILSFTTKAVLETKAFSSIPLLPLKLRNTLSEVSKVPEEILPDYDRYMEKAALLHEDVMEPFLVVLKGHLEDLQVFLGEIDTWVFEPLLCRNFIRDQFNHDLPVAELVGCGNSCSLKHDDMLCVRCFSTQGCHKNVNSTHSGSSYQYHGSSYQYHGSSYHVHDYCAVGHIVRGSFFQSSCTELKKVSLRDGGEIKKTFNISTEAEQARLRKFLEFVES
jgi:hypothetical protein